MILQTTFRYGAVALLITAFVGSFEPAAGQTQEELADAVATFDDPQIYEALMCSAAPQSIGCESREFCEVKVGMLKRLVRALDTNLPSLIVGASRQVTSDYIRNEANASCFDALTSDYPEFMSSARTIASGSEEQLHRALKIENAFDEVEPGCPSIEQEGLTVARYRAADLSQQVTYPLEAIGSNSAASCHQELSGFFSQRPQVTLFVEEPDDHQIEFQIVYSACDAIVLAWTAGSTWIISDNKERRPSLRLSGNQIDGEINIWVGTVEPNDNCRARFVARLVEN